VSGTKHEHIKADTFNLLLIFSTNSAALNLAGTNQSITNGLYDNRSCNDLYMQASTLEKDTFIYKTNINNNTTRVASYALTIFSPAVYYLGFTAYQNHKQQTRSQIALGEIDQIRLRMAEKRCFEQK